jgi:hypothetical protein
LDEGDEEDDRRDDVDQEILKLENIGVCEENGSIGGKSEKGAGKICDEVEDVILAAY